MTTQSHTLWLPSGAVVRLPAPTVPPSDACTSWLARRLHALGAGVTAAPDVATGPSASPPTAPLRISTRRHHAVIRGGVVDGTPARYRDGALTGRDAVAAALTPPP